MAVASGEVAQEGGEKADLVGVHSTGDGSAWQADFQDSAGRDVADLGEQEGRLLGRVVGRTR
jgi:hypothetical protein